MLEVGVCVNCNGGPGSTPQHLSEAEEQGHMALWALLKAPLLMGADPTNLTTHALGVLTNPAVIAVSQDPLGAQGRKLRRQRPSVLPVAGDLLALLPCDDDGGGGGGTVAAQSWRWVPTPSGSDAGNSTGTGRVQMQLNSSSSAQLCIARSNGTDKESALPSATLQSCDGEDADLVFRCKNRGTGPLVMSSRLHRTITRLLGTVSLAHSPTHSHTHSHPLPSNHHSALRHSLTHPRTHTPTHSHPLPSNHHSALRHSPTHPLTHSLTHSHPLLSNHHSALRHCLTHPLTHSLTLTHTHTHSHPLPSNHHSALRHSLTHPSPLIKCA